MVFRCFLVTLLLPFASGEFLIGRIPPGKFEYPELNGLMTPLEAKEKCESDQACAGFTFKGAYSNDDHPALMYFFHIVPSNCVKGHFSHWSYYKVSRNSVTLSSSKVKDLEQLMINNYQDTGNKEHEKLLKMTPFDEEMDNLTPSCQSDQVSKVTPSCRKDQSRCENEITIMLDKVSKVTCGLPKIDRCCKLDRNEEVEYDNFDNFERIDCNMSKSEFYNNFSVLRKPVILLGCQKGWKASEWTLENILERYGNDSKWAVSYSDSTKNIAGNLNKAEIFDLLKNGRKVKLFEKLSKYELDYLDDPEEIKLKKLDLIEDYKVPTPIPRDVSSKFNYHINQAYVMIASKDTGTGMHIDPDATDAFNGLVKGAKWWVVLPRDLNEFFDSNDWSCDASCSSPLFDFRSRWGAWYKHILPQIRNFIFYGQPILSGFQRGGETLYMPHTIGHSVFNIEDSVAVGDNFLLETSFEEVIGTIKHILPRRILNLTRGKTQQRLKNLEKQMKQVETD